MPLKLGKIAEEVVAPALAVEVDLGDVAADIRIGRPAVTGGGVGAGRILKDFAHPVDGPLPEQGGRDQADRPGRLQKTAFITHDPGHGDGQRIDRFGDRDPVHLEGLQATTSSSASDQPDERKKDCKKR